MVNFGPSANIRIGSSFHLQVNYLIQKSIVDDQLTSLVSGNMSYAGKKNGLLFNLQFTNPISLSKANGLGLNTNSYNLTVAKQFKLPIPGTLKRHSFKFQLFADKNLNGVQDEGDLPLEGRVISIGKEKLRTNKEGIAEYKNTLPGSYSLDLSAAVKEEYPAIGKQVELKLEKDKVVRIPFVPNKAIKGQLRLATDEYSNRKFSLSGVKLVAVDSLGNVYSALSDERGNFSIYAPAGNFSVSVKAAALGDELKTKSASYSVELSDGSEPFVVIELIQKKRAIRFIN